MPATTTQFGQFYTAYLTSPEWMSLPLRAAKVYNGLVAHANSKTRSWVLKIERLAQYAGVVRRTVFRALVDLEKAGLVERVHRFSNEGRQLATCYRLLPPFSLRGIMELPPLEIQVGGEGDSSVTPGGDSSVTPSTENQFIEISPPTPRCAEGASLDLMKLGEGGPKAPPVEVTPEPPPLSDPKPTRKARKPVRAQLRKEELHQLEVMVRQELDHLVDVEGPQVHRAAVAGSLPLQMRLKACAKAQGLSARRRDIQRALARVLEDYEPKAAEPDQVPELDWETLTAGERLELEAAMVDAGFMTDEAQALYATADGWRLFKRRQAQVALQLRTRPTSKTPCR